MGLNTLNLSKGGPIECHFAKTEVCDVRYNSVNTSFGGENVWYSNLAGARQGRGDCETVMKPEGLEKDPRGVCLCLRKRERAKRQEAKQALERGI
jgi:hypothetical protein